MQLDLSSNRLRVFADDVLPVNSRIGNLRLANNSLEVLEPRSLEGLKLDFLDLSHNDLTEIPSAIGKVEQMKKVDMSHNNIGKLFQYVLNKIKQLHTVDLSHNQIQSVRYSIKRATLCHMFQIGPYIFSDSSELHSLDLSRNEVSLLFKDAFARCPKLRKINLKDNNISKYLRRLNIFL